MLNVLLNGNGEQVLAERALPPLKDERTEIIARIVCKNARRDPDGKEPGGCCLDEYISDDNCWHVGVLPNGDIYVYKWMNYIELADEILKAI